jgi:hypothetical protein
MVSERQTGTTIARVQTPEGPEPHGSCRRIPTLRVLHPRTASAVSRWEATFGNEVHEPTRFGRPTPYLEPEGIPEGTLGFGRADPKGWLRRREFGFGRCRDVGEAPALALRHGKG